MATSVVYPFSKLNLGLQVLEKRSDGFHNIETLFYPHTLCDILEITDSVVRGRKGAKLFLYGLPIQGSPESNLCVQAYNLLAEQFALGPVEIHLYKQIPPGSGLGGSSSNAAFCFYSINIWFGIEYRGERVRGAIGRRSFFLQDTPPATC